jgi:methionyl aminopeptidase
VTATREGTEANGEGFSPAQLLDVRTRTRSALVEIAGGISPGMSESDARVMAADVLRVQGLRKGWHKILVRFGVNTLLNFDDPSEPDVTLGRDDIFFIDIGPIYRGHEGDAGDTFAVGGDPDMAQAVDDVHTLWQQVRGVWVDRSASGADLYRFAEKRAEEMGWELNLDLTGHRISAFPHRIHYDGNLSDVAFVPSELVWVLEIQIRHPTRPFGAFYEDLLLHDQGVESPSSVS